MFAINIDPVSPTMSSTNAILHSISSTGPVTNLNFQPNNNVNSYQNPVNVIPNLHPSISSTGPLANSNTNPTILSNDQFGDPNDPTDDTALKADLTKNYLTVYYVNEIKENLIDKKSWAKIGERCSIGNKIVFISSGVFTLVESYFKTHVFTLVSGISASIATGLLAYSSYAYKQSENKRRSANVLLRTLNLNEIPNDTIESSDNDSENLSKKSLLVTMKQNIH